MHLPSPPLSFSFFQSSLSTHPRGWYYSQDHTGSSSWHTYLPLLERIRFNAVHSSRCFAAWHSNCDHEHPGQPEWPVPAPRRHRAGQWSLLGGLPSKTLSSHHLGTAALCPPGKPRAALFSVLPQSQMQPEDTALPIPAFFWRSVFYYHLLWSHWAEPLLRGRSRAEEKKKEALHSTNLLHPPSNYYHVANALHNYVWPRALPKGVCCINTNGLFLLTSFFHIRKWKASTQVKEQRLAHIW